MSPSRKDRLRGVARKARESVVVQPSGSTSDVARLLASGLFDPWYYGLQSRVDLTPSEAFGHYAREGAAAGLLPNPLTDVEATGLGPDEVVAALVDGSARTFPVRPLLDDVALVAQVPEAVDHAGGPVGFYLEHAHRGMPFALLDQRPWAKFVHLRGQQAKAADAILAAGILDVEYYAAQVGQSFGSDRAAVWHFVERGESAGLTPSPLYDRSWYRSSAGVRMPMTMRHLLRTGQVEGEAGPQFDGATYLAAAPEAAEHAGGPLGHFLTHADASTSTVPHPDSLVRPTTWGVHRSRMIDMAEQLGRQRSLLQPPPSEHARWFVETAEPPAATEGAGTVAILADAREWGDDVPERLATVLAQHHTAWTLRVAVDGRSEVGEHLTALTDDPRVVLVPTTESSWSGRAAEVLATVTEPWVAVWQPQEQWSPGLLGGLLSVAATDVLAHAAAVDDDDDRLWGALAGRESLLWDAPRSLAAMLLPTERLRAVFPDGEADDRWGWDVLLRHDLEPVHVPFVGVRGRGLGARPLAPGHGPTLEHVRRAADVVDWDAVTAGLSSRVPGRVSVLMTVQGDRHRARQAIDHVLDRSDDDTEIIVVGNGSDPKLSSVIAACFSGEPRVQLQRVATPSHRAIAVHRACALSTGELLVLLDGDTEVQPDWLPPLVDLLRQDDVLAAQPVLLTSGDTIRSAGHVSAGEHVLPVPLLASHPATDLETVDVVTPDALSGMCLAVSAEAFASVRGLDPTFDDLADVDLSLRLDQSRPGRLAVALPARVSHRGVADPAPPSEPDQLRLLERWGGRLPAARTGEWEQAGFTVDGFVPGPGLPLSHRRTTATPRLLRPAATVASGVAQGLPRLRWAVKIAARAGASGDAWGDTYFADDVVRALRHWGQEAFVDRRGAHERPGADHLDDVTLTLRGLHPAVAQPAATNVLWVISHPDKVTVDEVRQGFDLVYSAGRTWADQMSAAADREVRTLLQATDTSRFTPAGDAVDGLGTLFVGRTRKVMRPVVGDAIEVGADLAIFGDGWEEFIDPSHVLADHLDNSEVPAAYRGARIVLNDHWADMARLGFYSNRLFDAVASGARVVSDPVDGLEDLFGTSVRTYRSLDELRSLLEPGAGGWPDDEALLANAARVAAEHSFEARARVMLADVLDARGVHHDLRHR